MSLSRSATEDEHSDVQDTTPNQEEGPTEMDLDLSGVSFSIIDIFQSGIHGQGHHSVTGITSFPDLVSTAEATTDSRQPSVLPSPTSSSSATLIGTSPPSALPPVNFTY
ncbi:hypothetical protein LTS18_005758, partial [Coniosporium uncinatum]